MNPPSRDDLRIGALIVTYNPDPGLLRQVVERLAPQVDCVLLVDNGSDAALEPGLERQAQVLSLDRNLGLAAAQNRGIDWAEAQGASHLVLLDQDSLVAPGMVAALAAGLLRLQSEGRPVAAVGPVYVDPRTGMRRPFVRFTGLGVQRFECTAPQACVETDFLIASGTLVPLSSFRQVGRFEEKLFIDNVDLEWSFRAQAKGLRLYGICAAHMQHYLGDDAVSIWLGRWWHIYRHSPVRQYYMSRNRILLYRRSYIPRGWILQDLLRFLVKLFMFGVFFPPRLTNLAMIFRGMRDGLTDRLGRYPG